MRKHYTHKHPKLNLRTEKDLLHFLNARKTVKLKGKTVRRQVATKDLSYLDKNSRSDWNDHPSESKPENGKYVRYIKQGSTLDISNRRLNAALKQTLDKKVPSIFYGSVSKKSHIQASRALCNGKSTVIISLDVTRFFESVSLARIFRFFRKAGCSTEIADILVELTCVPLGAKEHPQSGFSIARGFPTSPRLALWATFEIFVKLNRILQKRYGHLSPKLVVFVDDVGISLKNSTPEEIEEIKALSFETIESDKNGIHLVVHKEAPKLKVQSIDQNAEHLGLVIGKNSLSPSFETRHKIGYVKAQLSKQTLSTENRDRARKNKRGLMNYKRSVSNG
ncbi:MAG TPA: hypothetical protein ENJ75_03155 [Candidatus Kaiserbacteria bacterium]|nr:hypothetical protein [Candidatus Kaiserbacteria bacterium]